jgi:hypothetical protein
LIGVAISHDYSEASVNVRWRSAPSRANSYLVAPINGIHNACRSNGSQCYYKEKTWSFLDVIAQRSSTANWTLDPQAFRTVLVDFEQFFWDERDEVMPRKAIPLNATPGKASGTSDHRPVTVDIVCQP